MHFGHLNDSDLIIHGAQRGLVKLCDFNVLVRCVASEACTLRMVFLLSVRGVESWPLRVWGWCDTYGIVRWAGDL